MLKTVNIAPLTHHLLIHDSSDFFFGIKSSIRHIYESAVPPVIVSFWVFVTTNRLVKKLSTIKSGNGQIS